MVLLLNENEPKKLLMAPRRFIPSLRRISLGRWLFYLVLSAILVVLAINARVFSYSEKFILKDDLQSADLRFAAVLQSPFVTDDTVFSAESAEISSANAQIPVALVLGASVYSDGALSPLLEERAKTALELYRSGLVKKILVSGDNRVSSYNEVTPIRVYLLGNSVSAEDIFADFAGFNTYDSMYRAREIFGAKNVLIVTQRFHLPRAIYAARKIGLNAYGVPAGQGLTGQNSVGQNPISSSFKNGIREIFATVKTFFEVTTRAKPHFLGRQIPIEGDGRESLR